MIIIITLFEFRTIALIVGAIFQPVYHCTLGSSTIEKIPDFSTVRLENPENELLSFLITLVSTYAGLNIKMPAAICLCLISVLHA